MRVVILLPGRATGPVGGFAIAYQYANRLSAEPEVEVHLIHDGFRLRYPGRRPFKVFYAHLMENVYVGLGSAGLSKFKPWARLDSRIVSHSSLSRVKNLSLNQEDVVIATAVETAGAAADLVRNSGCQGWYFLQHVEDWNVGSEYLNHTLRLPLKKVAVAPWIRDYCAALGESCELVINAVDVDAFPLGEFGASRNSVSTLLSPGIPPKRTDIAIEVLNRLADLAIPAAAFGTHERPEGLDGRVSFIQRPSRSELLSLYQRSRVFFCVSETEGFGLTPAEATLAGCAVVSTNNGGVEAYGESFAVFTGVPDVDATLAAVAELMANPAEAQRRAITGRALLAAYTPAMAADRFTDLILGSRERESTG